MKAGEITGKILVIFDIDDTLVHTQTEVHVVKDGITVRSLNSHEFTHYKLQPGESFDFENFKNAREFFDKHKPIIPMMDQLKRDIARGNKVVMVTAREDFDDKELFLDTFRKYNVDIDKVHVYRAGNLKGGSTEERKKKIIKMLLDKEPYSKAIMYDDAKPNLDLFVSLKRDHPDTMFYAWHVSPEGQASEYMREGLEESLGQKLIIGFATVGGLLLGGWIGTEDNRLAKEWLKTYNALKEKDPTKAEELKQLVNQYKHTNWKQSMIRNMTKHKIERIINDFKNQELNENFADGKVKGKSRPGRVKKSGASCKGSVTSLRKKAKKYSGEKGKMYHWCANMKGGKK